MIEKVFLPFHLPNNQKKILNYYPDFYLTLYLLQPKVHLVEKPLLGAAFNKLAFLESFRFPAKTRGRKFKQVQECQYTLAGYNRE